MNETPSGDIERVRITEVGPRDGLQNQTEIIGVEDKVRLVDMLSRTGVDEIEVSSFVSKRWVPQLGDAPDVFRHIDRQPGVVYSALVPNLQGLAGAIEAAVPKVAVFTAASDTFCHKNINCSISQSLEKIDQVIAEAKFENLKVRGYISCVIECPYEGPIDPTAVVDVASQLRDMGVDEVDLGDTVGAATPESMHALLDMVGVNPRMSIHLHDTHGRACDCVRTCLELGIRSFDGAVAGLGGCPFAPGSRGNVATRDLIETIHDAGFETGVDLAALDEAAAFARSIVPSCARPE